MDRNSPIDIQNLTTMQCIQTLQQNPEFINHTIHTISPIKKTESNNHIMHTKSPIEP